MKNFDYRSILVDSGTIVQWPPAHTLKILPLIESLVDTDTVMYFTRVLFSEGRAKNCFIHKLKFNWNHYLSAIINHYIAIIRLERGKAKKNKLKYDKSHGVHPVLHSQKLHLSTTRRKENLKENRIQQQYSTWNWDQDGPNTSSLYIYMNLPLRQCWHRSLLPQYLLWVKKVVDRRTPSLTNPRVGRGPALPEKW